MKPLNILIAVACAAFLAWIGYLSFTHPTGIPDSPLIDGEYTR